MASSMKTNSNKTQVKFTQSGFPFESNVTFLMTLSCGCVSIFPKRVDQENENRRLFQQKTSTFIQSLQFYNLRDLSGLQWNQFVSRILNLYRLAEVIQGSPTEQCGGSIFVFTLFTCYQGMGPNIFINKIIQTFVLF